jgi:hypothetical protein
MQLDDNMPIVAVPIDLVSEPTTKLGYWFVSLEATKSTEKVALQLPSTHGTAAFGNVFPAAVTQDIAAVLSMGHSLGCQALLSIVSMELHILHVIDSQNPAATAAVVHETVAAWQQCGVSNEVLLVPQRIELGNGAVMLVQQTGWPRITSLRSAAHDGVRHWTLCSFCANLCRFMELHALTKCLYVTFRCAAHSADINAVVRQRRSWSRTTVRPPWQVRGTL